jgi:hypothetical protein
MNQIGGNAGWHDEYRTLGGIGQEDNHGEGIQG